MEETVRIVFFDFKRQGFFNIHQEFNDIYQHYQALHALPTQSTPQDRIPALDFQK